MTELQVLLLSANLLLTGLCAWLMAGWCLRPRARLYTTVVQKLHLAAVLSFILALPGTLLACVLLDLPLDLLGGIFPLLMAFAALIGVTALFLGYRLPDTWLVAGIDEPRLNEVLDKALVQSDLAPERTYTGLRFDRDTVMRLYYWRAGRCCVLEWHPRRSSRRFAVFQECLCELIENVPSSPRRLSAAALYAVGCSLVGLAATVITLLARGFWPLC
jgi:hypothetical protein